MLTPAERQQIASELLKAADSAEQVYWQHYLRSLADRYVAGQPVPPVAEIVAPLLTGGHVRDRGRSWHSEGCDCWTCSPRR